MDQLFKSNLTFCVVGVFTLQTDKGAFTIDSSTPALRRNLNEQPIQLDGKALSNNRKYIYCQIVVSLN
jgi:hypothetical protein